MSRANLVFVVLILLGWYLFIFLTTNQEDVVSPSCSSRNNGPLPPKLVYPPGSFVRRIVAVGDLHAHLDRARTALKMARVINAHDAWSGEVDLFVQTGDIIGRGNDTIALFEWMDQLRGQAEARGGQVISHLGNHEIMNPLMNWMFIPGPEICSFGGIVARQDAVTSGWLGSTWAANYKIASRLPLHPSLGSPDSDYQPYIPGVSPEPTYPLSLEHAAISFVHGGLSPTYEELTPFPSRINEIGASLLQRARVRRPIPPPDWHALCPGASEFPPGSTPEEERFYSMNGPVRYRGWALDPTDVVCARVDEVLQRTGTRRMVMGHTHSAEIVSRCNAKIIVIDTGIGYDDGRPSALHITYSLVPTNDSTIWDERETVVAIYETWHEILADDKREVITAF